MHDYSTTTVAVVDLRKVRWVDRQELGYLLDYGWSQSSSSGSNNMNERWSIHPAEGRATR